MSISELEKQIEYHRDLYYNDQPEIEDDEFDVLLDQLRKQDPNNKLLSKIGQDNHSNLPKRQHKHILSSQNKVNTQKELEKWWKKIKPGVMLVQHKLDGISLELQYIKGKMKYAITRGDGYIGDVLPYPQKMKGIPMELKEEVNLAVRGELILTRDRFEKYFADRFANPRNTVSGVCRRSNGKDVQHIQFMAYDIFEKKWTTEKEKYERLQELGFEVSPTETFVTVEDIMMFRNNLDRESIPYNIDGLVIKQNKCNFEDLKKKYPDTQIALKFPPTMAISVLSAVEWRQAGNTYTPVGILDPPVELDGTTVEKASLCNPDEIERLGLKIGYSVMVCKRGEIIPKIEKSLGRASQEIKVKCIRIPDTCRMCQSELINEGSRLYCPDDDCGERKMQRVNEWLKLFKIQGVSKETISKLYEAGYITDIISLYHLKAKQFAKLEGLGKKSAKKFLDQLHTVRSVPLSRFVAAYGIRGFKENNIDKLVMAGYDTLAKLRDVSVDELQQVEGFAKKMSERFHEEMVKHYDKLKELLDMGKFTIVIPTKTASVIVGKKFCFTGELGGIPRDRLKNYVKERGGLCRDGVTKVLDYLVTDDPNSGTVKNKKAQQLGVTLLDKNQFMDLLELEEL